MIPTGRRVSTCWGLEPCEEDPPARGGGFAQSQWFRRELFSFSCLPNIFTPHAAARCLKSSLKLNRTTPKGKQGGKVHPQAEDDASTPPTPSTQCLTERTHWFTTPSSSKTIPAFDLAELRRTSGVEFRVEFLPDGSLRLPGITPRESPSRCR